MSKVYILNQGSQNEFYKNFLINQIEKLYIMDVIHDIRRLVDQVSGFRPFSLNQVEGSLIDKFCNQFGISIDVFNAVRDSSPAGAEVFVALLNSVPKDSTCLISPHLTIEFFKDSKLSAIQLPFRVSDLTSFPTIMNLLDSSSGILSSVEVKYVDSLISIELVNYFDRCLPILKNRLIEIYG